MTIAQCKAARRKCVNDKRFRPKKGNRMPKSQRRAMALQRKGQPLRSVGRTGK